MQGNYLFVDESRYNYRQPYVGIQIVILQNLCSKMKKEAHCWHQSVIVNGLMPDAIIMWWTMVIGDVHVLVYI